MFLIKLNVLVIGNDHDTTAFPAGTNVSTIVNLVNDLNGFFEHAEMRFVFDPSTGLRQVFNTLLNNDCPDMQNCKDSENLTNGYARTKVAVEDNDKLTIIFRNGQKQIPGNFSSNQSYVVVIGKNFMTDYKQVAHELGHFFHLHHVFGGEPDAATVIETIRAYVEDAGHPKEEGLRALEIYDGDRINVGDTPFDLGTKIMGANPCDPNAKVKLKVVFKNVGKNPGDAKYLYPEEYEYIPQMRSNIMSYFNGCPWTHTFSKDQIEEMHKALVSGNRQRLLKGAEWDSASVQDLFAPAAVSRNSQTVAVYATDEYGVMKSRVWDAARGSYWPENGWLNLGGTGLTTPVVISRRPDVIDLFARPDNGKLVNKVWNESTSAYWPGTTNWADIWSDLVRKYDTWIASKPSVVSREPHLLDIFTRWTDGTVRSRSWDKQWSDNWENLGGDGVVGTPAIVSRRPDIIDLFVRCSDGSVRSKLWLKSAGGWYPYQTAWINLSGRGYDSPAVIARIPEKIDLFIRWNDGTIRNKVWDDWRNAWWPGNQSWFNLGGEITSEPVVVSRNKQSILLLARWSDGTVRIKVWDDWREAWWPDNQAWFNLGGDTIGRPAAVVRDENHIVVYARWPDNSIRSRVWNGATKEWWPDDSWYSLGQP